MRGERGVGLRLFWIRWLWSSECVFTMSGYLDFFLANVCVVFGIEAGIPTI